MVIKQLLCIGGAAILLQLSFSISAWDWPLENPVVSKSFLSLDNGEYSTGLLLNSRTSTEVRASETGTVLFTAEYVSQPRRVRTAHVLGGMIIIEHRNQFRTLYSDVHPEIQSGSTVASGEPIARIDQRRGRNGVYIAILDGQQQTFLNPWLLFPRLQDRLRPSIISFRTIFKQSDIIGDYFNVHISSFDRRTFSNTETPIVPPFVSVRYQSQAHTIFLDSVYSNGRYLYNTATNIRPNDLFTANGEFILGPFSLDPEQETIEIQVSDYNELSRIIQGSINDNE